MKTSLADVGLIEIDLDYPIGESCRELQVWAKHLPQLPRGHQQMCFGIDGRVESPETKSGALLGEGILSTDEDTITFEIPQRGGPTTAAAASQPNVAAADDPRSESAPARISFFLLGIEHIVTGYDHLLFLAAVLLVCKNFREAAAVITFFTVAHSITLTLAALDIVRMPARIVEPAIAASIVYVGLENIFGRHRFAWRAGVTFAFGLVHGLGFASALREVGLGSTPIGVAMPLLKFSVGLETGQLCIAASILQIMLMLKRSETFERRWVPAGSVLVSLIGMYWLVTRVLEG